MTDDRRDIGADLTPREREVLAMVAAGMTNREIGQALFISESTAGVHVSNLMAKLGAGSRTEAASVAYRAGLVESVSGDVTVVHEPAPQDALETPVPTGPWGRLTSAFDKQVELHPRRVASAGIGGLGVLFLFTVGLAVAVFGEEPVAGEEPDQTATPRPSASPSASPQPSASPTASPSLSPTPIQIGGAEVNLETDGLAEILVEDLVLRAEPGTGTVRLGQLPGGATAFVLAGPVIEDGFAWYQLAAVDPTGVGCGSAQPAESLVCRDWLGWAAAGGQDGEEWLEPVEPNCPAPGNPATTTALKPLERLACFGSSPMTLRVYVTANQGGGCAPGDPFTPLWLQPDCAAARFELAESLSAAGRGLYANLSPSLGNPVPGLYGRWVKITAHFDDPQAQNCSVGPYSIGTLDKEATILRCRAALVATAIAADDGLGTLDQRQDVWDPGFPVGYQPHASTTVFSSGVAQIFRAGRSGDLTAVQLQLTGLLGSTGPVVVEVRRDGPDGILVASTQASGWSDLPLDDGSCLPTQCLALDRRSAWVTIRFDDPATLTAGQMYAIVLPSGPITGSTVPAFFVGASSSDTYGAGAAWVRGPSSGDGWQSPSIADDLAFRTLVK